MTSINRSLAIIKEKIILEDGQNKDKFDSLKERLLTEFEILYQNPILKLIIDAYAIIYADSFKGSIKLIASINSSSFGRTTLGGFSTEDYILLATNLNEENFASVLIHEMTHAVIHNIYLNGLKPFAVGNFEVKQEYENQISEFMLFALKNMALLSTPELLVEIDLTDKNYIKSFLNLYYKIGTEHAINIKKYGYNDDLALNFSKLSKYFFYNMFTYDIDQIDTEVIAFYFGSIATEKTLETLFAPITIFLEKFLLQDIQKLYLIAHKKGYGDIKYTKLEEDNTYKKFILQKNFLDDLIANKVENIKLYIKQGFDINQKILYFTPLEIAIKLEYEESVELILRYTQINDYQNNLLIPCLINQNLDIIKILLKYGVKDKDYQALLTANKMGMINIVEELVNNNLELIKQDKQLQMKLFDAALEKKHSDLVDLYCQYNFENYKNIASFFSLGVITDYLRENIKSFKDIYHTLLFEAVKSGSYEAVKLLVDNGAEVNSFEAMSDQHGAHLYYKTTLDCALERGYEDIANLLINAGAIVNLGQHCTNVICLDDNILKTYKIFEDVTHCSTFEEIANCIEGLDDGNAVDIEQIWDDIFRHDDSSLKTDKAETIVNIEQYCVNVICYDDSSLKTDKIYNSLLWALKGKNPNLINKIANYGFDLSDPLVINRATEYGSLVYLVEASTKQSLNNLLTMPVNKNKGVKIAFASDVDSTKSIVINNSHNGELLVNGAQEFQSLINLPYKSSKEETTSALLNSVIEGDIKEIKLLLLAGANPYLANTIPREAFKDKFVSLHQFDFGFLLKHSELFRIGSKGEIFPFQLAAVMNRVDIIDAFLEYGLDINYYDIVDNSFGFNGSATMLHIAVYMRNEELIEYLLKNGADPNINLPIIGTPLQQLLSPSLYLIPQTNENEVSLRIVDALLKAGVNLFLQKDILGKYTYKAPLEDLLKFYIEKNQFSSIYKIYKYCDDELKMVPKDLNNLMLKILKDTRYDTLNVASKFYDFGVKFDDVKEVSEIIKRAASESNYNNLDLVDFLLEKSETARNILALAIKKSKANNSFRTFEENSIDGIVSLLKKEASREKLDPLLYKHGLIDLNDLGKIPLCLTLESIKLDKIFEHDYCVAENIIEIFSESFHLYSTLDSYCFYLEHSGTEYNQFIGCPPETA